MFKHWSREHQSTGARLTCFHQACGKSEDTQSADLPSTNCGSPKKKSPKKLPGLGSLTGSARDEEMIRQLKQGASIMKLASTFERTPEFIARQRNRLFILFGERTSRTVDISESVAEERDRLLKQFSEPGKIGSIPIKPVNRRGPWSCEEIDWLNELRGQGRALRVISSWLLRPVQNVKKRIIELEADETVIPAEPPELPSGLRNQLFTERLNHILCGLFQYPITPKWKDYLSKKSVEEWHFLITSGIPDPLKRALGSLTAPTFRELQSMPAANTEEAGVYARLMHKAPNSGVQDRFIYVGSAS
ncbi:MAG: hypothetical protein Q9221_006805 [Calogaya cf. arnoldii]